MKLPRRQFLHLAAGAAALPVLPRIARAQAYPARPIRLVIPFPPGGAFDTVGRPMADKMKPLLGTVIIENIGGAGASLGAATVARARSATVPLISSDFQKSILKTLAHTLWCVANLRLHAEPAAVLRLT